MLAERGEPGRLGLGLGLACGGDCGADLALLADSRLGLASARAGDCGGDLALLADSRLGLASAWLRFGFGSGAGGSGFRGVSGDFLAKNGAGDALLRFLAENGLTPVCGRSGATGALWVAVRLLGCRWHPAPPFLPAGFRRRLAWGVRVLFALTFRL